MNFVISLSLSLRVSRTITNLARRANRIFESARKLINYGELSKEEIVQRRRSMIVVERTHRARARARDIYNSTNNSKNKNPAGLAFLRLINSSALLGAGLFPDVAGNRRIYRVNTTANSAAICRVTLSLPLSPSLTLSAACGFAFIPSPFRCITRSLALSRLSEDCSLCPALIDPFTARFHAKHRT